MMITAFVLQIAGLALTVWGSWILLRGLFITDEEIEDLITLPISASTTSFERTGPLATTDPKRLKNYRDLFLSNRKEERRKGRCALRLFIVGFLLQLVGLSLSEIPAWICSLT